MYIKLILMLYFVIVAVEAIMKSNFPPPPCMKHLLAPLALFPDSDTPILEVLAVKG